MIYSAIASIDGFIEDGNGAFGWAEPDEEVFRFINDLERPIGTYLFGRRMYDTMKYWETAPGDESVPAFHRDFTDIWHQAEKIVFSRSLDTPSTARTKVVRTFDTDEISRLKTAAARDLTVGGAELAGQAIKAGLVDELQLFVVPVIVGGGKAWLPSQVRLDLDLVDSRSFASGFVFLRYRCAPRSIS